MTKLLTESTIERLPENDTTVRPVLGRAMDLFPRLKERRVQLAGTLLSKRHLVTLLIPLGGGVQAANSKCWPWPAP